MRRAPLISRSVLSDQVKDHLLQAILSGHYPPGSRIVETRVARELGLSQAPVREALRDLGALGVVEITAFQGARVRRPTKAELLEAFDVRLELESLGVGLAVSRLSDADACQLQEYVDGMLHAAMAGDTREEARIDAAFHARIIEIAGNSTLEWVWRHLEPVSRTQITFEIPGVDPRQIASLHQPILDALRLGDAAAARDAIRRHFAAVRTVFDELFVDPSGPGTGRDAGASAMILDTVEA